MYNVNPLELIQMIKNGKNPQQLIIKVLEDSAASTPLGENLLLLAKDGRTQEIEQVARNIFASKGLDFDQEFKAFKNQFGL